MERVQKAGRRRFGGEGGWTLMEVLVVTGMITVIAGIAVPQYAAMATQMRTTAAASRVLNDLSYARAMSQRTGVPHYVSIIGGSSLGYRVQREANPPVVAPGTDPVLRTIDLADQMPGVAFDLNGAGQDPYGNPVTTSTPLAPTVFSARGLPTAGGSYFVASGDGRAAYAISVNGSGRVRMWRRADGGWE
jgi:Tfp pilus assembly protein FimT